MFTLEFRIGREDLLYFVDFETLKNISIIEVKLQVDCIDFEEVEIQEIDQRSDFRHRSAANSIALLSRSIHSLESCCLESINTQNTMNSSADLCEPPCQP